VYRKVAACRTSRLVSAVAVNWGHPAPAAQRRHEFQNMFPTRHAVSIVLTTALLAVSFSSCGAAGSWKLGFDARDHPSLSYSEDGRTIFMVGCGHAFALHAKYPGSSESAGRASIAISNVRTSMRLRGEFEEPSADDQTTFVQWDLGFSRQDPELYARRWKRVRSRLLDLIATADPLTIASGYRRYHIPRVDVPGWRRPIERCGRGS
jgi:hypothetical protein